MRNILEKNKSLVALGFLLMVAGVSSLEAAGSFSSVDTVVGNFESSVNTTVGKGMKVFMGFLPLILMLIGLFLGVKQAKKKSEQEQENSNKVFISGAIGGIIGAFVGVLGDALLGAMLMQDPAKGLLVLKNYWTTAAGIAG